MWDGSGCPIGVELVGASHSSVDLVLENIICVNVVCSAEHKSDGSAWDE